MNKKLLFVTMSLAALTACTNDDFESKNVAQEVSPVQFEVLNNDVLTRASMNGNTIQWSANDGDLFTLYHGAALGNLSGYQNATYTATASEGAAATLTTPSMILDGGAVMVWPVDSAFRISSTNNLSIAIKDVQTNIANEIPYVSDLINIAGYNVAAPYNTAGYQRKYPVIMRPMASQLIVNADYAGSDAKLAQLYTGGSACPADGGIEPIAVTNVDLLTVAGAEFTKVIPVKFTATNALAPATTTAAGDELADAWATVKNNAWNKVTDFDIANIAPSGKVNKLSTKCIEGTESCKFLVLPQKGIAADNNGAGVLVNTLYGRVVVAAPGQNYSNAAYGYAPAVGVTTGATSAYSGAEYNDVWYRYISDPANFYGTENVDATATPGKGYKAATSIEEGMEQTLNGFSTYKAKTGIVKYEPEGAFANRYVKVLLNHLDMSDLHVKNDKHLRDAAIVWNHLNLPTVTVLLDGDATKHEFAISQKTIKLINDLNAAEIAKAAADPAYTAREFKVMPCQLATLPAENCNVIVITGGGVVPNIPFINANGAFKADVALNEGETWNWNGTSATNKIVVIPAAGVAKMINRGTLVNAADACLATYEANGTQNIIELVNNGTWNINSGSLNVQFNVTNNGTVNIAKGARYLQDGRVQNTIFINNATNIPSRFKNGNDNKIGKVVNKGVFATVGASAAIAPATTPTTGVIKNYGLIKHDDVDAKTYITENETTGAAFGTPFGATNKKGMITLPWDNKTEDNVSISAVAASGFVAVETVGNNVGALTTADITEGLSTYVNYIIINGDVTEIKSLNTQFKYVEINQPGTEIAWNLPAPTTTSPAANVATYDGLIVLSPVNIKLNTTINVNQAAYLNADMYVGGKFTLGGAKWNGYYGNTTSNYETMYITY